MGCQSCSFKHKSIFTLFCGSWQTKQFKNFDGPSIQCFSTTLGSTALATSLAHKTFARQSPINMFTGSLTLVYHFSMFQVCSACPWNFEDFVTAWKKQAVQVSRDGCWLSSASLGHTVGSGQCHRDNQSHVVTTSHCQSSQPACKVYGYGWLWSIEAVNRFVQALDS